MVQKRSRQTFNVYGTNGWFAPEIVKGIQGRIPQHELQRFVQSPIDIYALGLLLTALITSGPPASPWMLPGHHGALPEGVSSSTLQQLAKVKEPLETLATAMLHEDPASRPKAELAAERLDELLATLSSVTT